MRILAQKAQESAAERHFSLTDNIQTKNRGSMQPGSLEKRCLFRSEVLQEIAECADEASNHGLQTVDEAPPPPPPPPAPLPRTINKVLDHTDRNTYCCCYVALLRCLSSIQSK